jgi:predicted RNA binding protein YcfA (HicA-like mRNA interferase family)
MSTLPRVSGKDCVKALTKIGFEFKRQHGSHIILRRQNPFAQVVVPDHKEVRQRNFAFHHSAGRNFR